MSKVNDETEIDQTAVSHASAKLKLLADLFCAAGDGVDLNLNGDSLFGLNLILNECAELFAVVDLAVGARTAARIQAERRVN